MTLMTPRRIAIAALMATSLLAARPASAHFLWITTEPASGAEGGSTVRIFLNETAEPGGPQFLKYVKDVVPTADGLKLPVTASEETVDAHWAGKLPPTIDAESDLGLKTKDKTTYRLYYTARAQSGAAKVDSPEKGDKLRVRLVLKDDKPLVQVNLDGKPVAKARIKATPESGEGFETTTDDQGLVEVAGVLEGKTSLWANVTDAKAGEVGGKPFSETRYYATLTFRPASDAKVDAPKAAASDAPAVPTAFATMPAPAVNSFGGAVLDDWLYVYSGHTGKTHQYSVKTTSRMFRRLNLKDRTTWEELPMTRDVQGAALVTDGKFIYRVGGMYAKNEVGKDHDLISVADFARFDPEARTWTDLAPLPEARSTHDAVVVGRKVFAVGGWTMKGAAEESDYLDHAAVFDLDNPESGWNKIEQPFRRRALAAAEVGGKVYVLGGLNDKFKVERRVDVYDPSTGAWTQGPDLPGAGKNDGFAASAFGVAGHLYVSVLSGTIARLDDQGNAWEAVGAWSLPRNTHRILPGLDHSLLAVGGNYKGEQTPVIEAIKLTTDPVVVGARAGE